MKTTMKATTAEERRRPFLLRATEAAELIQRLVDSGMTPEKIAESSRVSERTIYRWWQEGRSPHPILLAALRNLAAKKGIVSEVRGQARENNSSPESHLPG